LTAWGRLSGTYKLRVCVVAVSDFLERESTVEFFFCNPILSGALASLVVKALGYKPEGRGFEIQ
jgi:hypothetical protein